MTIALALVAAAIVGVPPAPSAAATVAPIRYVHDAAGRLVTVMDASGGVARYTYDATGNVVSIVRSTAPALSVVDLSPRSAAVGARVSVIGRGFSITPGQNTVRVNGTPAAVVTATETELVVTVPSGATSGPVTVTTPAGTASGASLVVAPSRLPTVSAISPTKVSPGTTVTVTGTNFSTAPRGTWVAINNTRAVVTSATATTLTLTVPDHVTSGRLSLGTAYGRVLSGYVTVAPAPIVPADISLVTTATVGTGKSAPVSTSGKVALLLFEGVAGQRMTLTTTGTTYAYSYLSVLRPDGTPIVDRQGSSTNQFIDTFPIADTGTYTVVVDPDGTATGTTNVLLRSVAPDIARTIAVGGAVVPVSITTPGQNGTLTFTGAAGQRVALTATNTSMTYYEDFAVVAPSGATLYSSYLSAGTTTPVWSDVITLPVAGTYTVTIDPELAAAGASTFALKSVPADVSGAITVGGAAVPVTIGTPGQNARLTFTGTAGQRVALTAVNATMTDYEDFTLVAPSGTTLYSSYVSPGSTTPVWSDVVTLPAAGTYTIKVDPEHQGTGSASYALRSVPADVTGTVTVGGAAVPVTIGTPGQNARLTFTGTAGQRVALTAVNATMTDYEDFTLVAPSGTTLYSSYVSPGSTTPVWSDVVTLPAAGTYTIKVDPEQQGTGRATYAVKAVPADLTGTIVVGGAAVPVTVTAPGQNAGLTFSGTSGQRIVVRATSTTMNQFEDFAVLRPAGTSLSSGTVSPGGSTITPVITLDATGSHRLSIDPEAQGVGTVTYQLTVAPAAAGAAGPAAPPASAGPPDAARPGGGRSATVGDRLTTGPGARASAGGPGPRTTVVAPKPEPAPVWWQPSSHVRPAAFAAAAPTAAGTDREATPWAGLSPLQAPPGVTAVSGQVLTVDGLPLPGVTLGLASVRTTTDAAGRFLLTRVPSGKAVMSVDGATANTAATYGYYDVHVDAVAGRTSVLPWTTWMTPLDLSSTVTLPRQTTRETVVRTAAVPGLELHIPKWARVVGRDGKPVKEISLTPIPVDRPPFPLPMLGVDVPIYFTLQPGSAVVLPDGAQIHYPNYTHEPPGKQVEFWSYEPDEGWEPYGTGRVTADGRSVLPDPGTRIHEFTGAMFNAGNKPPPTGPKPNTPKGGDPVDLATGLFVHQDTDLHQPAELPLTVSRTYRPGDPDVRSFGIGSSLDYDIFLWSAHQYSEVDLILPDGGRVHLVRTSSGTGYSDAVFDAPVRGDAWSRAHMAWDADLFGWRLQRIDGMTFEFRAYTPVQLIRDRFGNEVRLTRDADKLLTRADSSDGRWMTFAHDTSKRITSVTDNTGRRVSYTYDAAGRLSTVVDPAGRSTTYAYDANGRMSTIRNARGLVALATTYDSAGRVATQTLADGGRFTLGYTTGPTGAITATTVTDQVGAVRRVTFDANGLALTDTDAFGTTSARTTTYTNGAGGLVTSVVDPLGRRTTNAYDTFGLLTSETTLAGTTRAATTKTTYDSVRHQVTSVTDQLGHVTRYAYLSNGVLSTLTDPTGGVWRFGTDAKGRILTLTEPTGGLSRFTWSLGDLVALTDPLGRVTRYAVDGVGQTHGMTDALGAVTQYLVDPVGQVTRLTDPLGSSVGFGYDLGGDVVRVTDQRAHATTFTYDGVGRRLVSTDPLLKADTLAYDKAGNITKRTRRTGAVSTYGYDLLGRRTTQVYGAATVTRSFDALDRVTRVTGPGGTITRTYDPAGDVASETTSQGTVTSSYDLVGRRVSMQVGALPATTYAYDAADRVTRETRGTTVVSTGYDLAGRTRTLTLGNGVVRTNTWDAAGQLTGIGFARAGVTLGTLAYTYDAAGRLASVGGTMARVVLPAAVTSAVYDAANRPTSYGGVALTHDADGNLRTDGVRTYTWDTRDRLVGVTGTPAAAYAYDDLGRRRSATVGGVATSFAYDDVDIVQEKQAAVVVPVLTGPGRDQRFARLVPAGGQWLLTDRLGSTVAITSDAGSLVGSYSYQPYGLSTSTGTVGTNPYRFTGRETDATGLSYHRARYLDTTRNRWASPDPVGFGGGSANLTQYVGGDPVDLVDLDGLDQKPPPDDCGFWCSVAKNVAKKLGMDQAKNPGPKGPKDAWKPSPRNEYSDQVKQYGNDAQQNSDRLSNPVKDAWNRASDALGGN